MNIVEKSLNTMEESMKKRNANKKSMNTLQKLMKTRETSMNMNEPMENHEKIDGHLGEITENHGK